MHESQPPSFGEARIKPPATSSTMKVRLHVNRLISAILLAMLALSACASDGDLNQPLSPIAIRSRLSGRTVMGNENGQIFYMHFAPNGVVVRNGSAAEYGQWRTNEAGLCLVWHDQGEQCMPVYQVHIGRYRLGNTEVNVFDRPVM
jgi:hypothetical protein